jgi:hypothetical protein
MMEHRERLLFLLQKPLNDDRIIFFFRGKIIKSTFLAKYFRLSELAGIEKFSVVFMPKILDMERGGHPLLPLPNLHQLTALLGAATPLGHGPYVKSATYFQKKFR